MKRFFRFLFILVFLFLLVACSPAQGITNGLQQLPDEGRLLVFMLVTAGATWALIKLSDLLKIDLKGYADQVAAGLAPILITIVESWLQLIPPAFDNIVLTLIHLLVLLVGSIGTYWILKRKTLSLR